LKAVVDTNVVACFLWGTEDFFAETHAFWNRTMQTLAPFERFPDTAARPGRLTG
jgi:hypothetical protein